MLRLGLQQTGSKGKELPSYQRQNVVEYNTDRSGTLATEDYFAYLPSRSNAISFLPCPSAMNQ